MALALLFLPSVAVATGVRVTVETRNGDIIEGAFKGASPAELTIETAGQSLNIALQDVRYISFVGRIGESKSSAESATAAPGSLEDAFAALDKLHSVVEVGVLRAQYAEVLVDLLPRVNAFIKSESPGWGNVRLALAVALNEYQEPLGEITQYSNPWQYASNSWSTASRWTEYARDLSRRPNEKDHTEDPSPVPLALTPGTVDGAALGARKSGRLGVGDAVQADGNLADSYVLKVPQPGQLRLSVSGTPCGLEVSVVYPGTRARDKWKPQDWKIKLKDTGDYWIVVDAAYPCDYELSASFTEDR
jgi:hypothetical protein